MSDDTPHTDYEALRKKAAQEGVEAVAKQLFYGAETPRTDTFSDEPIHPIDLACHMNEDPPTATSISKTPRTDAELF